jgi:hypothetical protein
MVVAVLPSKRRKPAAKRRDVFLNPGTGEHFFGDHRVMITLVLVVCLSTTPDSCREERPIVDVSSPMSCMLQGQQYAIEWLEEHPKWHLSQWRCEVGPRGKDA